MPRVDAVGSKEQTFWLRAAEQAEMRAEREVMVRRRLGCYQHQSLMCD
jgi:hypothetical protein